MDTKREKEIIENLASLNEALTTFGFALAEHGVGDMSYAQMQHDVLREHTWRLGYVFNGQLPNEEWLVAEEERVRRETANAANGYG
jgi:D-tyrosyl-tRNA(Tyr) deacylase